MVYINISRRTVYDVACMECAFRVDGVQDDLVAEQIGKAHRLYHETFIGDVNAHLLYDRRSGKPVKVEGLCGLTSRQSRP